MFFTSHLFSGVRPSTWFQCLVEYKCTSSHLHPSFLPATDLSKETKYNGYWQNCGLSQCTVHTYICVHACIHTYLYATNSRWTLICLVYNGQRLRHTSCTPLLHVPLFVQYYIILEKGQWAHHSKQFIGIKKKKKLDLQSNALPTQLHLSHTQYCHNTVQYTYMHVLQYEVSDRTQPLYT